MRKSTLSWVAGLSACTPMLVIAQPVEPTGPAVQLTYFSAFADYKPFKELEPGNWRALNDVVGAAAAKPSAPGGAPVQQPPEGGASATTQASTPAKDKKPTPGMSHPTRGSQP